jgi:FkbM family methyltransferase
MRPKKIPFADARYLLALLNPFRKKIFVGKAVYGLDFFVYKHDVIGREIFKRRIYESELTDWVLNRFPAGDYNFIDIGANLGYFTCLFGELAGKGRVISIEPEPDNLLLLNENIKKNRLTNVTVIPVAIGDKPGVARLNKYSKRNLGRHSLLEVKSNFSVEVKLSTLDQLVGEISPEISNFSLIKIDVEGYEPFAIKGAEKTLLKTDILVLEYNPNKKLFAENETRDLFLFLSKNFRKIYKIGDGLKEIDIDDCILAEQQLNLIFEK